MSRRRSSWFAIALASLTTPLLAQVEPVGEILQAPVEQHLIAERAGLEGLAVQVGTYGRSNDCRLELELATADRRFVERREVPARSLVDLHWLALPITGLANKKGEELVLRLRSPDARSGNAITVFCDRAATGGELRVGGTPQPGRLLLQQRYAGDHGDIGECVAGRRVVQTFAAPGDGLAAVRVLLTDYGRKNAGILDAVLRDPLAGVELARLRTQCSAIGNEHWLELRCAPVSGSGGRSFALELSSPDAAAGSAITALLAHSASYRGELTIDGEMQLGRLTMLFDCEGSGLSAAMAARAIVGSIFGLALWLLLGARGDASRRRQGRRLLVAAFGATAVVEGYLGNIAIGFYGGGLVLGTGLVAFGLARTGRGRFAIAQLGVGCWLAFGALLAFEMFSRVVPAEAAAVAAGNANAPAATATAGTLDLSTRPWSFDAARGDPARFAQWWWLLTGEWHQKDSGCGPLLEPDPLGELPFLVRSNKSSKFFGSTLATNSLGLRGPEVARDKGSAFRILCVGESTTMGQTLFATDVPWPERLQQLIAARGGKREVQVLNAGFAGYDLRHSVIRLRRFLLDLQPDLVVVYHGYNGFWMLLPDVAPALAAGARVPTRPERPSRLLAAAEYGLMVRAFTRAQFGQEAPATGDVDVDRSAAAAAYRELIALCKQRGAAVALCSFNMAVTRSTAPEVVAFYRQGFPQVGRQVAANELQTALLRRLCGDGSATFVDASQDLDGRYADRFVDLVHFTQDGREQMAKNVLAGITALLP